ncbi:MAG: hypothetical protein O7D93_14000 [Acidobacteria bacterium]|nr:hypothetical protein [Acidobacteriota bacterium]
MSLTFSQEILMLADLLYDFFSYLAQPIEVQLDLLKLCLQNADS